MPSTCFACQRPAPDDFRPLSPPEPDACVSCGRTRPGVAVLREAFNNLRMDMSAFEPPPYLGPTRCPQCNYPGPDAQGRSYKGLYRQGSPCGHCGFLQPATDPLQGAGMTPQAMLTLVYALFAERQADAATAIFLDHLDAWVAPGREATVALLFAELDLARVSRALPVAFLTGTWLGRRRFPTRGAFLERVRQHLYAMGVPAPVVTETLEHLG